MDNPTPLCPQAGAARYFFDCMLDVDEPEDGNKSYLRPSRNTTPKANLGGVCMPLDAGDRSGALKQPNGHALMHFPIEPATQFRGETAL